VILIFNRLFGTVGVKEQDRLEDDTLVKKRTRKG